MPNKLLGQHFLKSKSIVFDIIKAADLNENDIILEVGPGKGILTEALVEKAKRVIAVEKDRELVKYLREKFSNQKNLEIIEGDILKIKNLKFKIKNYSIVANIPYYITSHFLRKFLQSDFQPKMMVLMVQKEVAERIIGKPAQGRGKNKESILSISVNAYGEPKIIKKVPAKYFSPQPKVDSAILRIDNISKNFFVGLMAEKFVSLKTVNKGNFTETKFLGLIERNFFDLVKKGFSHKRKLLKNNLKILDIGCLIKCGISEKARAEDLSLENWKCLHEKIIK